MKRYLLKLVARLTLNKINVKYAQLTVFVPLILFQMCEPLHVKYNNVKEKWRGELG